MPLFDSRSGFALVLLVLSAASATAEPRAKITSFGRYEVASNGKAEKAERTVAGEVRPVDARRLVQQTDEVMGFLGNTFGFEVDLEGLPPGPVNLTIRTIHPPLSNPLTGKTMEVSEYDWTVTHRQNVYFGFTFDHRWEIGEGLWRKQILYDGRVIAEKAFKVVVPIN
jgi:hypothetical protein